MTILKLALIGSLTMSCIHSCNAPSQHFERFFVIQTTCYRW